MLFVLIDSIIKYSYLKIYGSTTRIILVSLSTTLTIQLPRYLERSTDFVAENLRLCVTSEGRYIVKNIINIYTTVDSSSIRTPVSDNTFRGKTHQNAIFPLGRGQPLSK